MQAEHVTTTVPGSSSRPLGTPPPPPHEPLDLLVDHLRRHPGVDGGVLLVRDRDGQGLTPAAAWFASPVIGAAAQRILERPDHAPGAGLAEAALARGATLLVPHVAEWEGAEGLRQLLDRAGEGLATELWAAYSRASAVACPVRDAAGQVIGALEVVSFDPERPLERDDLHSLELMTDLAALSYERSVAARGERAQARVESQLERAASEVFGSLETERVLGVVLEHSLALVGADRASISRLMPSGQMAQAAAAGEGAAEVDPGELAAVARSGRARTACGEAHTAHLPLGAGPRPLGVLSVSRGARAFEPYELELLDRLASTSVAAIVNADHFEQERRLARALTRGFVPDSLPPVEDYEVAALFEPAAGQTAGGDVYGLWTRPKGDLAILIGDVAGKGAGVAGLSTMARFFIEARSWEGAGPAQVLADAAAMLHDRLPEDTFVTAFLATVCDGELRCANAGHLPPLLARRAGPTGPLEVRGLPLGIEPAPTYAEHVVRLEPGDLLYAYSDGLTEARREGEMFGEQRLRAAIDSQRGEPGGVVELVESLHEQVRSWAGGLVDDATAMCLRRR